MPSTAPKLTPTEKESLRRLKSDFEYYAPRTLKIKTKQGKLAKFKLNPMQRKINAVADRMRAEGRPVRIIALKARQIGVSTWAEGRIFHSTAMNELTSSLIVAHKEDASTNLFNMSKLFYEEMPAWLRPMKKASNAKELIFENPTPDTRAKQANPGLRSKIKIDTAKNLGAGRSETVHNLHVSELAFWDRAEEVMTGLMQAVPDAPGTMVIVESTANGLGGYFYELWQAAVAGLNEFEPVFIAWFENPEYSREFKDTEARRRLEADLDETERHLRDTFGVTLEQLNWRRWCIANNLNGDAEAFKQEYPSSPDEAFLTSGTPVYDVKTVLMRLQQVRQQKPLATGTLLYRLDDAERIVPESITFSEDKNGPIRIYEWPTRGNPYVIGGDPAEGGEDYCTASVRNNATWNQAAVWRGQTDTDLYAKDMFALGMFYNRALVGIEVNFDSHPVKELTRLKYPRQYVRQKLDKIGKDVEERFGWLTNKVTRPMLIGEHVALARDHIDTFNDITTLEEMLTFVRNDRGRPEAQEGAHDDTIFADGIALQIREQQRYSIEKPKEKPKPLPWPLRDEEPATGGVKGWKKW